MQREKRTEIMVFLCLVMLVGLYYAAWLAWQKYQSLSAQLSANPGGTLLGLIKGS